LKKIVVTGSVAYDYLMFFGGAFTDHLLEEQLKSLSVSFLVDSLRRERGGVAANIAYTMALLGGNPCMMATVGQDFGEYRAWLEAQGVDTSATVVIPGEYCASFFVNTDRQQNQIGHFYAGAMAHAAELSFAQHAPDAELAIISPNAPDAMRSYVTECKALGIPYIYDPSQQTIRLSGEELCEGIDGAYLLAVNEYELGMIAEKTGLDEAAVRRMAQRVLVTRGAAGSDLWVDGRSYHIPAVPPHKVAEPTGAGDAFRGGLLRGIQLGLPWETVGRISALAATYVLEQMGTQNHNYTRESFISRYREHFGDDADLDALLA
jgi:adenosine kinase